MRRTKRTQLFVATSICAVVLRPRDGARRTRLGGGGSERDRRQPADRVGVSLHSPSAHRAKKRALNECHQSSCQIAVWVKSKYAAFVLKHVGVFVAGVGPTKNLAFAKARDRAHDHTAEEIAWIFSGY